MHIVSSTEVNVPGPLSPTIVLSIPIHTESEKNVREHWAKRAKRVRQQREAAFWAGKIAAKKHHMLRPPYTITLIRVAPRLLDGDNVVASLSAVRDGLADGLGYPNDRENAMLQWAYGQRQGLPSEYKVEIHIVCSSRAMS